MSDWVNDICGAFIAVNLLAWLIGIAIYFQQRENAKARMPQWEEAVRRWDQLYYCARCDGVFIPGKTPLISIGRMNEFLFAEPTEATQA